LAALAILALAFAPQQAGNSAGFESALRELGSKVGPISGLIEVVPNADGEQFVIAPAAPFVAAYGDAASPRRAEDCLTEAIYYEGVLEPEAGQRAIAQVVLNRVRHPEYPNSVCGVVFQGQHLSTGCQFTFTCDGSRARAPMPSLWRKANLVAKAALGGSVAKDVGLSTHYHADYVQPYWSHTLDQAGQIGRHIFYRWRGNAGRPEAFSSPYTGREPLIGQWAARDAGLPEATATQAMTLASEGSPADVLAGALRSEAWPPAPAPFKARPLRLATGDDGSQ
jgi:spore germination cell wall hydrolase CwlJ-like protein